MKLKREAHIFYIKSTALSATWQIVGEDIDDMSIEMGGSFDSKKNILGQNVVSDSGYTPSIAVSPYRANPDDPIYDFLLDLAMNRKSGDDAKADMLEVLIEDTDESSHDAWKESCRIEITSYGGNTEGFTIEYTVHPYGARTKGTASIDSSTKQPTFTAS